MSFWPLMWSYISISNRLSRSPSARSGGVRAPWSGRVSHPSAAVVKGTSAGRRDGGGRRANCASIAAPFDRMCISGSLRYRSYLPPVARPDFPRSIVEFQHRFVDERACLEYLAASRWPRGYRCPRCGGAKAWVLERRHLWECTRCHHQASVTAGTVLHGTRTPLTLWFWGAYLVATHTPGISAPQLTQLGLSRSPPLTSTTPSTSYWKTAPFVPWTPHRTRRG
jgi:hypothetical protein